MKLRAGTPEEAGMIPERIERLRSLCQRWVDDGTHPALGVLVARNGVICLHEAFGQLGPEPDAPALTRDAIFPIASVTKPITAVAALTLVDDGELSLSRPVDEYIPEFTGLGKEFILVHHLLTHTSGIRDTEVETHMIAKVGSVDIPDPTDGSTTLRDRYLTLGHDAPLFCTPGTKQYYSNYAYELLGQIIERVSGKSYADFVQERIFGPLGMTDSYNILPESMEDRVVRRPASAPLAELQSPYGEWWPVLKRVFPLNHERMWRTPWACGGVLCPVGDMAHFLQMVLNQGTYGERRILSKAAVAEMSRNHNAGLSEWSNGEMIAEQASYGYGWFVRRTDAVWLRSSSLTPRGTIGHGGGGGTSVWVDPVNDLIAVYFSVVLRLGKFNDFISSSDLFSNAVTAAVAD